MAKRGKPIGANTDATNRAKQAILKILTGRKRAGDDSPLINTEVKELLGISHNTVSTALRELREQGLIEPLAKGGYWKLKGEQSSQ